MYPILKRKMTKIVLALPLFFAAGIATAANPNFLIDAKTCATDLTTESIENFVNENGARRTLYASFGDVGSYVRGDDKQGKLIDVRGPNSYVLSIELIRHLKYSEDARVNPNLQKIIEESLKLAKALKASFSISSFVMPDGDRTIRLSLDMSTQSADKSMVVRLPNLEIRNGESIKRVDIDIKPDQLNLLTGTTLAFKSGGRWLVGEPASHSLGLSIIKEASNVLIDTFGSPASRFTGPESHPPLRELLDLTERLARAVYPRTGAVSLRENDDIMAVSDGRGWQLPK